MDLSTRLSAAEHQLIHSTSRGMCPSLSFAVLDAPLLRKIYIDGGFAQDSEESRRTFAALIFTNAVALWSAVFPLSSSESISAPLSRRIYTDCLCSRAAIMTSTDLCGFNLSIICCFMEWRPFSIVRRVNICALIKEDLRRLPVLTRRRILRRRTFTTSKRP